MATRCLEEPRCLAGPKLQEVTETFYLVHANRTQLNSQEGPFTQGRVAGIIEEREPPSVVKNESLQSLSPVSESCEMQRSNKVRSCGMQATRRTTYLSVRKEASLAERRTKP